ncbi:MAG: endolytic transglycosylase MltG [Deltaproteobacteria bacterium]|nr:endolytic transglycosylase MltG [Deltaproteobacteria bacterium]
MGRKKNTKRMKGRLTRLVSLAALLLVVVLGVDALVFLALPPAFRGEQKSVVIRKGSTFREVVQALDEAGLLRSPAKFSLMARILGVTGRVQAGEYTLSTAMIPPVILRKLVTGDVVKYRITIPEGYTVRQIAARLEEKGIIQDQEEFLAEAFSPDFAASMGIQGVGIEGYLFPDTYLFSKGVAPAEVIKTMMGKFTGVYGPAFAQRAAELGLTDREVVTLASIIEKETGVASERPLISAVFHNRLKRGMPLCSDPTVIYGIAGFDGNLRKRDLEQRTPYNTYLIQGLPPGPIANPGRASLEAALYPAPVNYLYFVSRNDGSHHFSTTLREHNEAVRLYQRGGRGGSR